MTRGQEHTVQKRVSSINGAKIVGCSYVKEWIRNTILLNSQKLAWDRLKTENKTWDPETPTRKHKNKA